MKRGFLKKLIERIRLVQPGNVQNYLVEIAREKGFLETIFNAIREGVMVPGPGGRVIYLNQAACGFFGVDPQQSLGKPLDEVVRGLDLAQLPEEVTDNEQTYEKWWIKTMEPYGATPKFLEPTISS